jgi:hypothetical protein
MNFNIPKLPKIKNPFESKKPDTILLATVVAGFAMFGVGFGQLRNQNKMKILENNVERQNPQKNQQKSVQNNVQTEIPQVSFKDLPSSMIVKVGQENKNIPFDHIQLSPEHYKGDINIEAKMKAFINSKELKTILGERFTGSKDQIKLLYELRIIEMNGKSAQRVINVGKLRAIYAAKQKAESQNSSMKKLSNQSQSKTQPPKNKPISQVYNFDTTSFTKPSNNPKQEIKFVVDQNKVDKARNWKKTESK